MKDVRVRIEVERNPSPFERAGTVEVELDLGQGTEGEAARLAEATTKAARDIADALGLVASRIEISKPSDVRGEDAGHG